jgi:hypothetical protein
MSTINASLIKTNTIQHSTGASGITFSAGGQVGVGFTDASHPLQVNGIIACGTRYLIEKYVGIWADPGSYPEYMLVGRTNTNDTFRVIGTMYGFRGGAGERNTMFSIACSKTTFPSTAVTAGAKIGTATFNFVTLTYAGNPWVAIQSVSPGITGGLNMWFTGIVEHNYSSSQWTHRDFYGNNNSIPSGSVSGVSAAIVSI